MVKSRYKLLLTLRLFEDPAYYLEDVRERHSHVSFTEVKVLANDLTIELYGKAKNAFQKLMD